MIFYDFKVVVSKHSKSIQKPYSKEEDGWRIRHCGERVLQHAFTGMQAGPHRHASMPSPACKQAQITHALNGTQAGPHHSIPSMAL